MYLRDADTLSLVHADDPRVTQRRHMIPSAEIATSIMTRIEILRGRFDSVLKAADAIRLLQAQQRLLKSEELLSQNWWCSRSTWLRPLSLNASARLPSSARSAGRTC